MSQVSVWFKFAVQAKKKGGGLEREKSNVLEEEEWAINTALFLVLSNKDC
jgi:hypothetical protein